MLTTTWPGPATGSGASPYVSFSGPPWPVSKIAFIDHLPLWSTGRRHCQTPDNAMPLDQAGDDSDPLCLLDDIAQKGKAGGVLLRRANRLLHRGKLAVEDARAGQLLGE